MQPLTGMREHVHSETALCCAAKTALVAGVRAFTRVRALVLCHLARGLTSIFAFAARIRAFAGMRTLVFDERVPVCASKFALDAGEGTLAEMQTLVIGERSECCRSVLAFIAHVCALSLQVVWGHVRA